MPIEPWPPAKDGARDKRLISLIGRPNLRAWDRPLAFERENTEDALVNAAERFARNETLQGFDP